MTFYNIKKGDQIDVISPSCACTKEENENIKNLLKNHDFLPNIFAENNLISEQILEHEFSPFDPKIRFEQFQKAVENPNSKIIWCAKGGYGAAEILPFLQKLPKPKTKKIFIGFSDITSLNKLLIEDWGWEVVVGPMLNQIAQNRVGQKSIAEIFNLISGQTNQLQYDLKALNQENTILQGELTGGCLSVLCGNFATKSQINWQNKILFLEDEGEDGERLDRYFYQIFTMMVEQNLKPKAVILGNFLHANPHGTPKGKNIEIAITKFVQNIEKQNLQIPIFQETQNQLGHSQNMMPIILGKNIKIENQKLIQNV